MRAMVFDIVKARLQVLLRHIEQAGKLILQIAHLRRVAEPIFDLTARQRRDACGSEQYLFVQVRGWITRDPHMVQILNTDSRLAQTIPDRLLGKTCGVLEPIEPLLFGRSNQPTIADDRRRCVSVISIYSQYVHLNPFFYPCNLWLSINSAIMRWNA